LSSSKHITLLATLLVCSGACRTTKKGFEQVKNVTKWKGCLVIDLPVITLTPERTQAERQLIGSEKELEPDGWLIATPASVIRSRPETADNKLVREKNILLFYDDMVRQLKDQQLLGEKSDGLLGIIPGELIAGRRNARDLARAEAILNEVNVSRKFLVENGVRANFRDQALPGHWIQNDRGEWQIMR
jgi:hypothetical protein